MPSRRACLWYGTLLAVSPFLTIFVLCWIASTEWFLQHDAYPGARVMGYAQRIRGLNCEIVVYGDSTALTELDPAILTQRTGLTACNISEGSPVHVISGSHFVMDEYLKHNTPPRFLLSAWSATLFRPDVQRGSGYAPEGVIYAMHYDHRGLLPFFLRPRRVLAFLFWATQRVVFDGWERLSGEHGRSSHFDERAARAARRGVWTYRLPPETSCTRPFVPLAADVSGNRASVEAFRRRYSSANTRVFVDVSAVPACDLNLSRYAAATAGASDNRLEVLPIRDFNQGDVHISQEGAKYMSNKAAEQILEAMRSAPR